MAVKKLTGVSAEQLASLRAGNFEPMAKVYALKEPLITIPAGYWDYQEKEVSPKSGSAFTVKLAVFKIGNETFERTFRSGEEIDTENEIVIGKYVAERDQTTSNGYKIVKGTVKQFAANA